MSQNQNHTERRSLVYFKLKVIFKLCFKLKFLIASSTYRGFLHLLCHNPDDTLAQVIITNDVRYKVTNISTFL